jgi:phosphate transport system substrate-binding protein
MAYLNDTVRAVTVEGLLPTPENVSRGEYHLTRELIFLSRQDTSPPAQEFFDFAVSPAGQSIVAQNYGRVR